MRSIRLRVSFTSAVFAAALLMAALLAANTTAVTAAAVGQGGATVWDSVYSETQASRGEPLYAQYCASCHGPDLSGGEIAPPLVGPEFGATWNDVPLSDLIDRMFKSMPLNAPESVTRAQDADILGFMLKKGGFPAGAKELSGQPGALADVKFLSAKP